MSRPREHVVETLSRRIVAATLPADRFVERDQTERDYGIDLSIENFVDGEPSGRVLLLQVKGTDAPAPNHRQSSIPFDARVDALVRCERFATPILLVWVPVQDETKRSWFLWLQSYIRIVLDHDKPKWRSQTTVRLHIPVSNLLGDPRSEPKLIHIGGEPARSAAFGQLSRLAHEARWKVGDPTALREVFREALRLDAIFGDPDWDWGQLQRQMIERGLLACDLAMRGTDPTDEDLKSTGWVLPGPVPSNDWQRRWDLLAGGAEHCAQLMSAAVATYYDDRLRNTVWKCDGGHDF